MLSHSLQPLPKPGFVGGFPTLTPSISPHPSSRSPLMVLPRPHLLQPHLFPWALAGCLSSPPERALRDKRDLVSSTGRLSTGRAVPGTYQELPGECAQAGGRNLSLWPSLLDLTHFRQSLPQTLDSLFLLPQTQPSLFPAVPTLPCPMPCFPLPSLKHAWRGSFFADWFPRRLPWVLSRSAGQGGPLNVVQQASCCWACHHLPAPPPHTQGSRHSLSRLCIHISACG